MEDLQKKSEKLDLLIESKNRQMQEKEEEQIKKKTEEQEKTK